jgi:hypothetical protein
MYTFTVQDEILSGALDQGKSLEHLLDVDILRNDLLGLPYSIMYHGF